MNGIPHRVLFAPLIHTLAGALPMCRSIKQLRQPDRSPTDQEIEAAALQFVRKISGYRAPSRANEDVFERAVQEISTATRRLLTDLVVKS
jgi:hypothetical protein